METELIAVPDDVLQLLRRETKGLIIAADVEVRPQYYGVEGKEKLIPNAELYKEEPHAISMPTASSLYLHLSNGTRIGIVISEWGTIVVGLDPSLAE